MAEVFISYRRSKRRGLLGAFERWRTHSNPSGDLGHATLFQFLLRQQGVDVFLDTIAIAPGARFPDTLSKALSHCRVLLALIGQTWVHPVHLKRLKDPDDWVRRELEHALQDETIKVIPVCVDEAEWPPKDLPDTLAPLADLQKLDFRTETVDTDFPIVHEAIRAHLDDRATTGPQPPPDLLPFLCDRVDQLAKLREIVTGAQAQRVLACVLPGHKYEGHARFLERVRHSPLLEQIFQADRTGIGIHQVQWSPAQVREKAFDKMLRQAVKSAAIKARHATDEAVQRWVATSTRPEIFTVEVSGREYEELGPQLLKGFHTAWTGLFGTVAGMWVLWINLYLDDPWANPEIAGPITGLPQLSPVTEGDIQRWIGLQEVMDHLKGRDERVLRIPNDSQWSYAPGKVHMLRFADAVRTVLASG